MVFLDKKKKAKKKLAKKWPFVLLYPSIHFVVAYSHKKSNSYMIKLLIQQLLQLN